MSEDEKPTWQSIQREFREATVEARIAFNRIVGPLKAKRENDLAELQREVADRRAEARAEADAAARRYQFVLRNTLQYARAKERAIEIAYAVARAPAFRTYKEAVAPAEAEKKRKWQELIVILTGEEP